MPVPVWAGIVAGVYYVLLEDIKGGAVCKGADSKGGKRQGVEGYDKSGENIAGDSQRDGSGQRL